MRSLRDRNDPQRKRVRPLWATELAHEGGACFHAPRYAYLRFVLRTELFGCTSRPGCLPQKSPFPPAMPMLADPVCAPDASARRCAGIPAPAPRSHGRRGGMFTTAVMALAFAGMGGRRSW